MIEFILVTLVCLLSLAYLNGRYNEWYWTRRGVVFHNQNKLMGPFWDYMTKDKALFQLFGEIYNKYPDAPAVGIGSFLTPTLFLRDLKNIQYMMQSFNHRGVEVNENDKLSDNVLLMNGNRWKLMRQSMTPLFTSAKLKNMFYIMDRSAQDFVELLKKDLTLHKGNAFETLTSFSCAAISASVFGLQSVSVFDSPFAKMAKDSVQPTFKQNLAFSLALACQPLFKLLKLKIFGDQESFFIPAIKKLLRAREQDSHKYNDFGDICVQLQKNGTLKDRDTGLELIPTDELLAAQGFFFFIAGVEPTATAMFCTLFELGRNPEILDRVHQEIDALFESAGDDINYEKVWELEYLDKVFNEAMRMYPPIGFLTRQCTRDTVLPVGNIKLDKGTKIITALFDVQNDPKYFPNPEVFDPEQTVDKELFGEASYLAFGKGARLCIGARYAKTQMKTCVVRLLRNFTVKTVIGEGGIKYKKSPAPVRPINVDVEFIPRKLRP